MFIIKSIRAMIIAALEHRGLLVGLKPRAMDKEKIVEPEDWENFWRKNGNPK